MTYHEIHSWTLFGLVRAFLDLAAVYFLLCVSAIVFIPSKILKMIGLYLPCPCTGFYGYQNSDLCLLKLLVNWPKRKIHLVLDSVKGRFPFDLILIDDQMGYSERNLVTENHHANGIPYLQSEACCSTFCGSRLQNLVNKVGEYDGKGKRIIYQRPRTRIRRRRAVVENEKPSRILLNDNLQINTPGIFSCEGNEAAKEGEYVVALNERENFISDDCNESNHIDLGERTWHGFESNSSVGENSYVNEGSLSVRQDVSNALESGSIRDEASSLRLLEQALEKEKVARASLYLELEKERAAAATAADEAIAMISRLQNDKAAIEMEARQYQRLIEEKFAYDEEEMNILREILVRREIDNHVLEKEIEAFRQMGFLDKEQSERNWGYIWDECRQQSATTLFSNGDPPIIQQIENANSFSTKTKVTETANFNSLFLEKHCHLNEGCVLKQNNWSGKDKELTDNSMPCEHITTEAAPCYIGFDKSHLSHGVLQENLEHIDRVGCGLPNSVLDMEIDVQDIHVIDEELHIGDKIKREERNTTADSSVSDHPRIPPSPLEDLMPEA